MHPTYTRSRKLLAKLAVSDTERKEDFFVYKSFTTSDIMKTICYGSAEERPYSTHRDCFVTL